MFKNKCQFVVVLVALVAVMIAAGFRVKRPGLATTDSIRQYDVGKYSAVPLTSGTFVTLTQGYVVACAAGADAVWGIALSDAAIPDTSGDTKVLVDTNLSHVFWVPADATADVTLDKIGTLIDIASATQADGNASTDDVLEVMDIDPSEAGLDLEAGFYVRLNPEERGPF